MALKNIEILYIKKNMSPIQHRTHYQQFYFQLLTTFKNDKAKLLNYILKSLSRKMCLGSALFLRELRTILCVLPPSVF